MKPVAYLTTAEAAEYLGGFPSVTAFRKWLSRPTGRRLRRHRLGRELRFRRVDLDAVVETEPQRRNQSILRRVV